MTIGSPGAEISVRVMQAFDFERVSEMYRTLDQIHLDRLPGMFQEAVSDFRGTEFCREISDRVDEEVFVAVADHVLGLLHVRQATPPELPILRSRNIATIDAVYVDPNFRRRGVASALMNVAENWARTRNLDGLELTVYQFNDSAERLFSGQGFETLHKKMTKPLA